MAVPKSRTSKSKKNKRRASAYKLPKVTISTCSNCNEPKLPHRVCQSCGHYDGREVLDVE